MELKFTITRARQIWAGNSEIISFATFPSSNGQR